MLAMINKPCLAQSAGGQHLQAVPVVAMSKHALVNLLIQALQVPEAHDQALPDLSWQASEASRKWVTWAGCPSFRWLWQIWCACWTRRLAC